LPECPTTLVTKIILPARRFNIPFIAARAVTLWCNAGRFADARDLALACLRGPDLDPFARMRLQASLDRARIAADATMAPPSARLTPTPFHAPAGPPYHGAGGRR